MTLTDLYCSLLVSFLEHDFLNIFFTWNQDTVKASVEDKTESEIRNREKSEEVVGKNERSKEKKKGSRSCLSSECTGFYGNK